MGSGDQDVSEITLGNYYRVRREHPPFNVRLDDVDVAVAELAHYSTAGGTTIVELSSIGLGRDPVALREISRRSGVHIIMGCGFYWSDYHPTWLSERTVDELARQMITDLVEGVDGTGIRAGVIGEVGLSWPIHPDEERVLRAAVRAQRATGAGLVIHPGHHRTAPLRIMDIVRDECGDPSRTVIGHLDRTLFALDDMLELAETGCYLEFDLFGQEMSHYPFAGLETPVDMPSDATRVDYLADLTEHGHLERLIISQDVFNKTSLRRYGGEGYGHILEHILPLMARKGFTEEQIRTITTANPHRVLARQRTASDTHFIPTLH